MRIIPHALALAGAVSAQAMPCVVWAQQTLRPTTIPEIARAHSEGPAADSAASKLSPELIDITSGRGRAALRAPLRTASIQVIVDAPLTSSTTSQLSAVGAVVDRGLSSDRAVRATVPVAKLKDLAGVPSVKSVERFRQPRRNQSFARQGLVAHSIGVGQTYGLDGRGVKVGVISDSVDVGSALKRAIDHDRMGPVQQPSLEKAAGRNEGLAMLEIVHAIAPAAELYFAPGGDGDAQFVRALALLEQAGCNIIIDDLSYPDEPPFQDGPIAAAASAAASRGVLIFSAAGNFGSQELGTSGTWEGKFASGAPSSGIDRIALGDAAGQLLVWDVASGATANEVRAATSNASADLFWAEPYGQKPTAEYDLFVIRGSKGHVVKSSLGRYAKEPHLSVSGLQSKDTLVIMKVGDGPAPFLHIDLTGARLAFGTKGNIRGHAASANPNIYAVAAVPVPSPATPFLGYARLAADRHDSDGPRRMFFQPNGSSLTDGALDGVAIPKPDLAAAEGVSTTLQRQLNPFVGSSAAAPHAGALAALAFSCPSRPSPESIRDAFRTTSLLVPGATADVVGAGVVYGPRFLAKVCPEVVPPITPLPPAPPVSDPLSPGVIPPADGH